MRSAGPFYYLLENGRAKLEIDYFIPFPKNKRAGMNVKKPSHRAF